MMEYLNETRREGSLGQAAGDVVVGFEFGHQGDKLHAVCSIRVWSTRVNLSPVLKIFRKTRVFSKAKY